MNNITKGILSGILAIIIVVVSIIALFGVGYLVLNHITEYYYDIGYFDFVCLATGAICGALVWFIVIVGIAIKEEIFDKYFK